MFKKLFNTSTDSEVVVEKPSSVKETIQEIHNSFNNEGDRLLAKANEILGGIVIKDEAKSALLEDLGFVSTKEVQHKRTVEFEKKMNKTVVDAIMQAKKEYPLYKYITEESAKRIANKYNLVLGTVGQYKGFVPHKNALEIKKFFENHPEDVISYTKTIYSSLGLRVTKISKEEYEKSKNIDYGFATERYSKAKVNLNICAPLSDMNVEDHKLVDGWKLEKEIPDPIVMLEKEYNGVKGFIIITAWGDEASDPEVINEQLN